MNIRVHVVEDNPLMRMMVAEVLGFEEDIEVCGASEDAEDALANLEETDPDLMLVDISLPGMSGIDFVSKMQEIRPDLPVVLLSGHAESFYVSRAMKAGSRGFVVKGEPEEIVEAIRAVLNGEEYLSPVLSDRIVE